MVLKQKLEIVFGVVLFVDMVHTEILVPVGNSTWLLGQILVLSVSNTVMYYKLVTSISLEPRNLYLGMPQTLI